MLTRPSCRSTAGGSNTASTAISAPSLFREAAQRSVRARDELDRHHNTHMNDKRMLRICRSRRIKSTIKYNNHGCTRQGMNPYYLADNLLNREFKADKPNQKWLTDVTEFKYYVGIEVKKVYLSAILDLYDRRIVSYVIRDTNNNPLVFDTFRIAQFDHFHVFVLLNPLSFFGLQKHLLPCPCSQSRRYVFGSKDSSDYDQCKIREGHKDASTQAVFINRQDG